MMQELGFLDVRLIWINDLVVGDRYQAGAGDPMRAGDDYLEWIDR